MGGTRNACEDLRNAESILGTKSKWEEQFRVLYIDSWMLLKCTLKI
jgi:hypothetical protein